MRIDRDDLYVGTDNVDGCQVWRTPLISWSGFESGTTSAWSSTVP